MAGQLPDTQPCYQQPNNEILAAPPEIPELRMPGNTKRTINMNAEPTEPTQHHHHQTVSSAHAEPQNTVPPSPRIEEIPLGDQNPEITPLLHFYSSCKLSFIVKMALLRNVKALGYALSEEDMRREQKAIEDARTKALEAWEKIRERGISYDVNGCEYLKTCTLP